MNTNQQNQQAHHGGAVDTVLMKPYAVVKWTLTTYALVDMALYRRGDDDEGALLFEDQDAAKLEAAMHRLNARHMRALLADVRKENRLELTPEAMEMLNAIQGTMRESMMRDMKAYGLPPELLLEGHAAVIYQSSAAVLVEHMIRNHYKRGIQKGTIQP